MSCVQWEERIALYAGGDLAAEQALAVEEHLRACAGCVSLAVALEQDREWLATGPPEAAQVDYAAMRARIRREIARTRWRWIRWAGIAAAAAIVLAAAVEVKRSEAPAPKKSIAAAGPVAHALVRAAPAPMQAPGARSRARSHAKRVEGPGISMETLMRIMEELDAAPPEEAAGSDSPLEMRIATRDPDVTIIVVQETNGDSR
jgi:hypothetical protein